MGQLKVQFKKKRSNMEEKIIEVTTKSGKINLSEIIRERKEEKEEKNVG